METIAKKPNTATEKIAEFMDKAPGLVSAIVTLIIVAEFIAYVIT